VNGRTVGAACTIAFLFAGACKKMEHASGEISRHWSPSQQGWYMGVPAADVHAAISTRLAGPAPAPLTRDQWTHVVRLYGAFNQSLLWLDDQGVHQSRVKALLLALADADSDWTASGLPPSSSPTRTCCCRQRSSSWVKIC
jgi:hypothetical protein